MPIVVDHDERRDLIARVVKKVIAEQGMDAVTIRNVAREAGFKSTLISHYFKDKKEMLIFTLESIREAAALRVEASFNENHDLATSFDSLLPISGDSLEEWRAWFGFWGKATFDPELSAVLLSIVEATNTYLWRALEEAKKQGDVPKDLDTEIHARRLQMILNGIATLTVISPEAWPPDAQRAMLAAELELMKNMPHIPAGLPQPTFPSAVQPEKVDG